MKRTTKRTVSMLLVMMLFISLASTWAYAADPVASGQEVWDIVLVVDCSASLNQNDKDGLRYEAVESLLWSLNADYAEVGAVLFRGNNSPGKDLRNGTKTYPISSIKAEHERSKMIRLLRDESGIPRHESAQTDYYTALLVAEEMLRNRGNDRPGAIFLFTDGELSVLSSDEEKAKDNLDTAIREIREDNVLVCGVYLNATSKNSFDKKSIPVKDIVSMANEGSGRNLHDLYVEINTASECYEPTDRFLHALGYDTLIEGGQIINTTTPIHFILPGIGIDKLAFRISSQETTFNGQINRVLKTVTFQDPSGHTFDGDSILSFHGTYRNVYELTRDDVESRGMKWVGDWTVTVVMNEGAKIGVILDPVFAADVDVEVEPANLNGLRAKTDLVLTGRLAQATQMSDYEGYTCTLELTAPDGNTRKEELRYDASVNGFPYTIPLTYGNYRATYSFGCSLGEKKFERDNTQTWTVTNLAPSANLPVIRFSLINPGSWRQTLDLSDYLVDEDDTQALQIRLPNRGKGISLNGKEVQLRGLCFGSAQSAYGADQNGHVLIDVTDTEGETAHLKLIIEGGASKLTVPLLIVAGIFLVAIAIVAVLTMRRISSSFPSESCSAEIQIENSSGRPVEVQLSLPSPGSTSEVRRVTTLYKMLNAELNKGVVESLSPNELDAVRAFAEAYSSELSRVQLKCCSITTQVRGKNRKLKKCKVYVPVVQHEGRRTTLYNNSVNLNIGDTVVTLGYVLEDEQDTYSSDSTDEYATSYSGTSRDNGSDPLSIGEDDF